MPFFKKIPLTFFLLAAVVGMVSCEDPPAHEGERVQQYLPDPTDPLVVEKLPPGNEIVETADELPDEKTPRQPAGIRSYRSNRGAEIRPLDASTRAEQGMEPHGWDQTDDLEYTPQIPPRSLPEDIENN